MASGKTIKAFLNNLNKVLDEMQVSTVDSLEEHLKESMPDDADKLTEFFNSFRGTMSHPNIAEGGDAKETDEKSSAKQKKKKEKDTNKPPTDYDIFRKKTLLDLKNNSPEIASRDRMSKMNELWNAQKKSKTNEKQTTEDEGQVEDGSDDDPMPVREEDEVAEETPKKKKPAPKKNK